MNQKQFDYLLEYIQSLETATARTIAKINNEIQSLDNDISNILERIETLER